MQHQTITGNSTLVRTGGVMCQPEVLQTRSVKEAANIKAYCPVRNYLHLGESRSRIVAHRSIGRNREDAEHKHTLLCMVSRKGNEYGMKEWKHAIWRFCGTS
eukprot:361323-Chlamydomonas_euryale.AAC.10